jgi:hypothetical protein
MDYGVRIEFPENGNKKLIVCNITDVNVDFLCGLVLPYPSPFF